MIAVIIYNTIKKEEELSMKLRKQILAVALAVSMAVSCPGAPGIQVTGVKAAGETELQEKKERKKRSRLQR